MIRRANENDIDRILKIYEHIHDAEEAGEAVIGWDRNVYPTYQTVLEGLAKKDLFVEENENTIVAAGRINQEQVKEYADCPWSYQASDHEVMVLHTLVVDPQIKWKGYGLNLSNMGLRTYVWYVWRKRFSTIVYSCS